MAKKHPQDIAARIRDAGLKPTRQRIALGALLFAGGHRHVTCEGLHSEAAAAGANVSLATVYNTMHQFRDAGLLREVKLDADRRWFDTNAGAHHHFFIEQTGALIDIPEDGVSLGALPAPPRGYAIEGVDVVIRLRSRKSA
jgi:Fur family iron response transcriptional regulator